MREITVPCEGCGDSIVGDEFGEWKRHHQYRFDIPTEERHEIETKEYVLCRECILKIIDFIEEDTNYAEERVDKSGLENTVYSLEDHAERLQNMADQLKDLE